jgi:hypothetical protein
MQTIQPVKQGGRRRGAGRPKGSGRYGELTVPIRIPASLLHEAACLIRSNGRKRRLYVVGSQTPKPK